jgi:hypothetical protein
VVSGSCSFSLLFGGESLKKCRFSLSVQLQVLKVLLMLYAFCKDHAQTVEVPRN